MTPNKPPLALEDRKVDGAILFSPSAGRNKQAIGERLSQLLPANARVLELGSGTGEHGEEVCRLRPDVRWTPSDPDPASRASCEARARALGGGLQPPLPIDLTDGEWWRSAPETDAIFCANTIHIAPWEAAEGVAIGASQLLRDGGLAVLYGPFLEGAETAPSNLRFDADLRARDSRWGVRDRAAVETLFRDCGFVLRDVEIMPANNRIIVFAKRAADGPA